MKIETLIKRLPEENSSFQNYAPSLTRAEANAIAAHDIITEMASENMARKKSNVKLEKELSIISQKLARHQHLHTAWDKIDTQEEILSFNSIGN